jgi:hypothetical protein
LVGRVAQYRTPQPARAGSIGLPPPLTRPWPGPAACTGVRPARDDVTPPHVEHGDCPRSDFRTFSLPGVLRAEPRCPESGPPEVRNGSGLGLRGLEINSFISSFGRSHP